MPGYKLARLAVRERETLAATRVVCWLDLDPERSLSSHCTYCFDTLFEKVKVEITDHTLSPCSHSGNKWRHFIRLRNRN